MKSVFVFLPLTTLSLASCVVNPDADKAFREQQRQHDSTAAAERGVIEPAPDTGQYGMPVAPIGPGDMPVVNPADTARAVPK